MTTTSLYAQDFERLLDPNNASVTEEKRVETLVELGKIGPAALKFAPNAFKLVKKAPWSYARAVEALVPKLGLPCLKLISDELEFESQFPITGFKKSKHKIYSENGDPLFWFARYFDHFKDDGLDELELLKRSASGQTLLNLCIIEVYLRQSLSNSKPAIQSLLTRPKTTGAKTEAGSRQSAAINTLKHTLLMLAKLKNGLNEFNTEVQNILTQFLVKDSPADLLKVLLAIAPRFPVLKSATPFTAKVTEQIIELCEHQDSQIRSASLRALIGISAPVDKVRGAFIRHADDDAPGPALTSLEVLSSDPRFAQIPASARQKIDNALAHSEPERNELALLCLGRLQIPYSDVVSQVAKILNTKADRNIKVHGLLAIQQQAARCTTSKDWQATAKLLTVFVQAKSETIALQALQTTGHFLSNRHSGLLADQRSANALGDLTAALINTCKRGGLRALVCLEFISQPQFRGLSPVSPELRAKFENVLIELRASSERDALDPALTLSQFKVISDELKRYEFLEKHQSELPVQQWLKQVSAAQSSEINSIIVDQFGSAEKHRQDLILRLSNLKKIDLSKDSIEQLQQNVVTMFANTKADSPVKKALIDVSTKYGFREKLVEPSQSQK